jgi:GNAT superfamily N-acetyltransferase
VGTDLIFEVRESKNDWELEQARSALMALVIERENHGAVMLSGERTKEWIYGLIETGTLVGAFLPNSSCLIGVLLAAPIVLPFDTEFKQIAGGFGTYVLGPYRGQGVAEALYTEAKRILSSRGFDCYMGSVMVNNASAKRATTKVGFKEHEVSVLMRLK